jgi:hypothetical protein
VESPGDVLSGEREDARGVGGDYMNQVRRCTRTLGRYAISGALIADLLIVSQKKYRRLGHGVDKSHWLALREVEEMHIYSKATGKLSRQAMLISGGRNVASGGLVHGRRKVKVCCEHSRVA